MRKLKVLLFILVFFITGCVKYNTDIKINWDKSMDFKLTIGTDSSIFKDGVEEFDADELRSRGFTVTEYSEDNIDGYTIYKKIKNIDDISSNEDIMCNLSEFLNDDIDKVFQVKKGFLKNKYIAKIKVETSDSMDAEYSQYIDDETSEEFQNELNEMLSQLDLSFNVHLPYSAVKSNANDKDHDNKNLSWNLYKNKDSIIEFEFEVYNFKNIAIYSGAVILFILFVIFIYNIGKGYNSLSKHKVNANDKDQDITSKETINQHNDYINQENSMNQQNYYSNQPENLNDGDDTYQSPLNTSQYNDSLSNENDNFYNNKI